MIKSGGAYANVHTTANPMGEIRGQIVDGKTGTAGATDGTNTANQGISQSNTASTSEQCAAGTLTGPSCNGTTNQGNVNTGSNTAGQTAGGGTGTAATGGQNTANQGIVQSNSATTAQQCAAGTLIGPACNSTTNQGNVNSGSNTAGQRLRRQRNKINIFLFFLLITTIYYCNYQIIFISFKKLYFNNLQG